MQQQRRLIDKIRAAVRTEAPAGVIAIEHGEHIHLPSPSQRSWIEIRPAGPFNRWRCAEYRADRQPTIYIADSDWQITAWLLSRWRGQQPNTPAITKESQPCHA